MMVLFHDTECGNNELVIVINIIINIVFFPQTA